VADKRTGVLKSRPPETDALNVRYLLAILAGVTFALITYPSPWGIVLAAFVSFGLSRLMTILGKIKEEARLRSVGDRPPT
jgi:hypothetical protein